jgi:HEAT repeat protein
MAERWFFFANGQVEGPVTPSRLQQLASAGQLQPTTLVWPESGSHADAQAASAVVSFPTSLGPGVKPGWLADVDQAKRSALPPSGRVAGRPAVSQRRWLWLVGGSAALGLLVGLGVMLVVGLRQYRKGTDISPQPAKETEPETALQILQRGVQVTGEARPGPHQEMLEGNVPWTCQRWQIDLSLVNGTPWELELGKDFFLFEANADLSLFEGVVLFRGIAPKIRDNLHLMPQSLADPFGLPNNFQVRMVSGWYILRRGNRSQTDMLDFVEEGGEGRALPNQSGRPRFSPDEEDPRSGFGFVAAKQSRRFQLILDQGITLADPSLRERVQIVLPELTVAGKEGPQRYRLVVHLQKSLGADTWQVRATDWVHVRAAELTRLLEAADANAITRICAANWLADIDPAGCAPTLVQVAGSLREGQLLITCLQLLSDRKGPGLEKHALRLLLDAKVSPVIRCWAALYLGVMHYELGLGPVVKAASDANDAVALGAIYALGAYGPRAAEPLVELLRTGPAKRASLVAENLVFTKVQSKEIFAALCYIVDKEKGKEPSPAGLAALTALVKGGFPDTFVYLEKWAGQERQSKWQGAIAHGLLEVGEEQGIPLVLKMLEKDQPPPEDQLLLPDELVLGLRGGNSPQFILGLQQLARSGNLRAVQVLAGNPQEAAFVALGALAQNGSEAQVFIALDGLAQRWARQSVSVFRDLLKNANSLIVQKAIEGLGNSGDAAAIAWLDPLRDSTDAEIRKAVKLALQRLQATRAEP